MTGCICNELPHRAPYTLSEVGTTGETVSLDGVGIGTLALSSVRYSQMKPATLQDLNGPAPDSIE